MAAALAMVAADGPAGPPPVSRLHPIALHDGVNRVPGFLPGGSVATIVQAWRGNGNAHGYHDWMVLGGASEGHRAGVIGVDGGNEGISDVIGDDPFDGERVLGAVRFATANLDGRAVALLIRADLGEGRGGVAADHATALVRWYRLDHQADAIGRPTDAFVPIGSVTTTRRYCNAELALRDVAHLPLPGDFAGANRTDGCFADG